jgi:hypothetical protein
MREPSDIERVAVERGANDLIELVRFHYKTKPRELARLNRIYTRACVRLYRALDRSFQKARERSCKGSG